MPTQSDDIISISPGTETFGLGGADEFTWAGGSATIHGGDTDESYDESVYMDKTGGDRLIISEAVKLIFASTEDGVARAASGTLVFDGTERIHLGDGNDMIRAGAAAVDRYGLSIWAGGGNDDIIGSRAGDFIDGGSGNDTIRAGLGDDFVQSSTGNDLIYGGAGNDNIRWGQGNFDEIVGNDTIFGGAGSDLINVWIKDGWENSGGVAVNVNRVRADGAMVGGAETDIGGAQSTLRFQGFEMGWTHEGQDTVSGAGAKVIGTTGMVWNTRWGDDVLTGTGGNDTLEGGEGRDTITGGAGNDLISANGDWWAGAAAEGDGDLDTLIFREGHGADTILGFDAGLDVLDLGARAYAVTATTQGVLLTAGQDSILLAGIHEFEV
ncbi:MAG: hypothetical protein QM682_06330 [Paracoccus sp. (in: a-proteobacteria)]|uniref:calcium-binding protein n=1 Tax=Paracoccus sp. TaxID=267 RepID=UPI0039E68BEE